MTAGKRPGRRSGVYLTADDDARIEALGAPLGAVLRAGISSLEGRSQRPLQTAETLAALDKDSRHPGDKLPDPKPPTPHGWTFTGTLQRQPDGTDRWVGQMIARPASLDELLRLVSTAPGRVRLGSAHVLIVSEVSDV